MSKAYWNYRVVIDEEGAFVTDVYYTDGKPDSWGELHPILYAETPSGLNGLNKMVQEAFEKPPLFIKGGKIGEVSNE